MNKFKIGDTVVRTGDSWNGVEQGTHYLVIRVGLITIGLTHLDGSDLPGPGKNFSADQFALATDIPATTHSTRTITKEDILNLMVLACDRYMNSFKTSPEEAANDVFNDYINRLSTK
jgi:hypothetical protein